MRKKLFAIFIIFLFSSLAYCEDFTIKDGVLEKCKKNQEVLRLPETVKKVGENAFSNLDKVRKLYISKNVESCEHFPEKINEIEVDKTNKIYSSEDGILYNKDKTKIIKYPNYKQGASFVTPDTVTFIKNGCFTFSEYLEKIYISKNINKIEDSFKFMENLEAINVSDANKNFQSVEGVLFNRSLDKLISYPQAKEGYFYTIPSGVNIICNSAFMLNTKLVEVTIPDSVEVIENVAFSFTNLKTITVPKNIKYIGGSAFAFTPIKKITFKLVNYDRMDNFDDDWMNGMNDLDTIVYAFSDYSVTWDLINEKVTMEDTEGNSADITKDFYESLDLNYYD